QPPKPKIVVVGGDYFSKDDFAQLDEGEKVAEIKLGAPADNMEHETSGTESDSLDFDSLDFVTETLAKIYADQGYYDKAIEVYAKLILLYPEKSTYFATLVNEIKSKN
ncbi:MAG: tetratricopeptide repeat protein, partial [Bacteroidales bacterium]|nr:tetratricopeptide repeat protein [Bacteroidales bacterium]